MRNIVEYKGKHYEVNRIFNGKLIGRQLTKKLQRDMRRRLDEPIPAENVNWIEGDQNNLRVVVDYAKLIREKYGE